MEKIEILENGIWKETGWEFFKQLKEYPFAIGKEWSDDNYNYLTAKFLEEQEVYRQKVKKCEGKCKCKSCRPEKTIFVLGQTEAQAREYIRTNVKTVTELRQLAGYTRDNILIVLSTKDIKSVAKARDFEIIEA